MKKTTAYLVLAILILVGAVYGVSKIPEKAGAYDEFATCVADSGATFWGAFWCPHCNDQKKLFGRSAKLLPYTECSTPDGRGQTNECTEAGIESYPTWDFAVGTTTERIGGVLTFEKLSEMTGCAIPTEA